MDYRGRIYCQPSYFNYQGTELAKSLLLFSRGEKISKTDTESIKYLKIYGANCYGNKLDKQSANDRIKWIDEHEEDIINFENGNLIKKAESPLLFIAFCFEYNRWLKFYNEFSEKIFFTTYLPIQLDATCNGFQHISMLGLDKHLYSKLNIKPTTWDDAPDDFYSLILALIKGYLGVNIEKKKNREKEIYERLYNLNISRSVIKKCVMTIPYNISKLTGIDYLMESFEFDQHIYNEINIEKEDQKEEKYYKKEKETWFRLKEDHDIRLELDDFKILHTILMLVLYEVAPSLENITKFLKTVALICSTANTHIPWTLPTGLTVQQSYLEVKDIRISPFSFSKTSLKLQLKGDNMDIQKNIRALMPNLIHSLDAASLSLLIHKYFKAKDRDRYNQNITNIFAIHDCFATTCNNMKFVIESLKLIYISIYSEKTYLRELDLNMKKHIKSNIDPNFEINSEDGFGIVVTTNPKTSKIKEIKYTNVDSILKNHDISEYIKRSSYIIN